MSKSSNTGLKGPAVAVAAIVVCFVAYQVFFAPHAPKPTESADKPPATTRQKVETPTPPPAEPAGESKDVPAARTWSTYHGGPELCGFSDVQIPDGPAVLWQYIAEGDIRQPAVGDEHGIYVVTSGGLIVALDFAGKERWKKQLRRTAENGSEKPLRINAPIGCYRSTVVVGSNVGIVHAIDSSNGEVKWTYDVGGEILGAANFYGPEDPSSPALLYTIERGEGVLHGIDFATGTQAWRTDPIARTDGSMAVANGNVIYGSCDFALHVYGAADGKRGHAIALCGDCQVASGPAVVGDEIYSGSRSGHFYRADASTGAIAWMNDDCTTEVFTTPAVARDVVVYGSEDGNLYCLDRTSGKRKWTFESGGLPTSPVIAADRVLVGVDGALIMLEIDTGDEVWRYEVSDGIAAPSIINGAVVVASEDGTAIAFGPLPKTDPQ